jgi:hypothetical protein
MVNLHQLYFRYVPVVDRRIPTNKIKSLLTLSSMNSLRTQMARSNYNTALILGLPLGYFSPQLDDNVLGNCVFKYNT